MKSLSDKAVALHKDYVKNLTLRCSALEKSAPEVIGKTLSEIRRMRFLNKADIIDLRCEIECHEIFFSSLGETYQTSKCVKNKYNTEASFLYELLEIGCAARAEFLGIYKNRDRLYVRVGTPQELLLREKPILTVDLCEHAYLLDFGLSKREYLKNLLPYLNLSKLDDFLQYKH